MDRWERQANNRDHMTESKTPTNNCRNELACGLQTRRNAKIFTTFRLKQTKTKQNSKELGKKVIDFFKFCEDVKRDINHILQNFFI